MIAIIDIDGVLADFEGRMVQAIEEKFGVVIAGMNRHVYSFSDRYRHYPEVVNFCLDFVNNRHNYRGLDGLDSGKRFIWEVGKYTNILFCTSRPEDSFLATHSWLERHFPSSGWNLQVKKDKAKWIKDTFVPEQIAFIVDDNPDVCNYLNKLGFLCFCWRQPWNEGVYPAIIPGREEFFVVEDDADAGENFLILLQEASVVNGGYDVLQKMD